MQIKNINQLVILAALLTFFNLYSIAGNSVFSYRNLNALMLSRDDWYLYYFAFIAVPLVSFVLGVSVLLNVLNNKIVISQSVLTGSNVALVKLLYVYVALNFLLIALLSTIEILNF